ncbi:MAG: hypothetical protein ACOCYP_06565 [Planctomycetota bacterium]
MLRSLTCCLALLAIAGCRAGQRQPELSDAGIQVAGFDPVEDWTQDSAGNHAELSHREIIPGDHVLQVRLFDNDRDRSILRREVDWNCGGLEWMSLDLLAETPETTVAIGLRGANGTWFETPAQSLTAGWNRDLRFPLDAFAAGDRAAWQRQNQQVDRVMIFLAPPGDTATVLLDRLSVNPGARVQRRAPVSLVDHQLPPRELARHACATWELSVNYGAQHPTDEAPPLLDRMLGPRAQLRGPDGRTRELQGYCRGISSAGHYRYALHFTPELAGTWHYAVAMPAPRRTLWLPRGSFTVTAPSERPGFIRRDPSDPRYFARDGALFYPLGHNLGWAGDYRPWLDAVAAAGGNLVRVWLCPWNHPLGANDRLHVIDFAAARRVDALLDAAGERGLTVQLVLQYHGLTAGDWARNPLNRANGGPAALPEDVWRSGRARRVMRRLHSYIVARWGHHPALFAWELVNEVDLTHRYADADLIDWHRDMLAHLAQIDVHDHLVTTSCARIDALTRLWDLGEIDFIQPHAYRPQPGRALRTAVATLGGHHKPLFFGELGRDYRPAGDQRDPSGRHLRQALWLNWLLPTAGAPLPWWWDTHLAPNDLLAHHRVFARFTAGEDPRGRRPTVVESELAAGVRLRALIDRNQIRGFVYRPANAAAVDRPPAALFPDAHRLQLSGAWPGPWQVQGIDPAEPTTRQTSEAVATADGLELTLPAGVTAWAFKAERRDARAPAARVITGAAQSRK